MDYTRVTPEILGRARVSTTFDTTELVLAVPAVAGYEGKIYRTRLNIASSCQVMKLQFCHPRMPQSQLGDTGWRTARPGSANNSVARSEEHTSELKSLRHLVCRLL